LVEDPMMMCLNNAPKLPSSNTIWIKDIKVVINKKALATNQITLHLEVVERNSLSNTHSKTSILETKLMIIMFINSNNNHSINRSINRSINLSINSINNPKAMVNNNKTNSSQALILYLAKESKQGATADRQLRNHQ
jgi:hypothetical protein